MFSRWRTDLAASNEYYACCVWIGESAVIVWYGNLIFLLADIKNGVTRHQDRPSARVVVIFA